MFVSNMYYHFNVFTCVDGGCVNYYYAPTINMSGFLIFVTVQENCLFALTH
jgi:hypothetical protein